MEQGELAVLKGWENFYVIVGSSGGALTGLQFVVMTLMADSHTTGSMHEIRAFGTPTVVHFCVALLIAGMMTAPWETVHSVALCLGVLGAVGIAYSAWVIRHAWIARYRPDAEDWIWYGVMPPIAYGALIAAAVEMERATKASLFGIAATTLVFLFLGIHNSWDTVTYIAVQRTQKRAAEKREKQGQRRE